jgi:glutathione synthase/RimK-type ligase-like ATP-grasp enzyme
MRRLVILTDEDSDFLISISDFKNYTSMDISKIKTYFTERDFFVEVLKFSELDLKNDYRGVYFLYQTAETPGSFYKHYIEDLIYFLEKQGAFVMPKHELLKAHHNKVFMEMMRFKFSDESLKTITSRCYGSWVDARNYDDSFPVVVKQSSGSGSEGVYLAKDKREFNIIVKKAGQVLIASGTFNLIIDFLKKSVKRVIKFFNPSKAKYIQYDTRPVSRSVIVQNFIEGLDNDCKVLVFGRKYYARYRKVRPNDFRASGSGISFDVPDEDFEGLLNFARKLAGEIDFPIIGMDLGFDGKQYHLFEFQMIHLGPYLLHKSRFWHEFHDGKWVRFDGASDLEEEFSRTIYEHILSSSN